MKKYTYEEVLPQVLEYLAAHTDGCDTPEWADYFGLCNGPQCSGNWHIEIPARHSKTGNPIPVVF